jgi:hypothetical protein
MMDVIQRAGGRRYSLLKKSRTLRKVRPWRLKAQSKPSVYRSAEALRHPKAATKSSFSANCLTAEYAE